MCPASHSVLTCLGALIVGCVTATFAADTTKQSEPLVPLSEVMLIERGMHRNVVRATFGAPAMTLAGDVWVYFDVQLANKVGVNVNGGRREICDCMVVKFAQDRADLVKFCEGKLVRDFIAKHEKSTGSKRILVIAKPDSPSIEPP